MEKFNDYLESIGIGSIIKEIIEKHYNFYSQVLSVDITDIFISEFVNSEGNRVYENLWFFNDTHFMEMKNFLSEDDYDMDTLYFHSWNIKKTKYDDVNNPISDSRIYIDGSMPERRHATFKASGTNCKDLFGIFQKHIMTNSK